MIQVLTVLPCTRAIKGPNGFHVKAGSFKRTILSKEPRDLEFLVCLRVEGEPPPDVRMEIYDPFSSTLYVGRPVSEDEPHEYLTQVVVRFGEVVLSETGEYAFTLVLNGERIMAGPLWGSWR